MTVLIFFAVLFAALLHASWNALVKGNHDKHVAMTAIVLGHIPVAALCLVVSPVVDLSCWPYIIMSVILHVGYQIFLMNAYRMGDLTQVYPIARGIAPLIVTGVSIGLLGTILTPIEFGAIGMIAIGVMSVSLLKRGHSGRDGWATIAALATGCFIAGYSLNDGIGARVSGNAIAFYAIVSFINAAVWWIFINWLKPGTVGRALRESWRMALFGGSASALAYTIVVWAFASTPIALVVALRETSIIFALVLGTVALRERLDLPKILATSITFAGVALLRLSAA